nr:MAG TPA: hypothetical protein [Caudoviricetes sp.]
MWSFLGAILVILAAVFLMPMMIFLIIFLLYRNLLENFEEDEK